MVLDFRLLGIIMGALCALFLANIQVQIDRDLVPYFLKKNYYVNDFPGIASLKRHQIFQNYSQDVVKIAIVGSSSAESLGCDASWVYKDLSRTPIRNNSTSCSITYHTNLISDRDVTKKYEFFNLAKAGAKFLQVAQISKRIIESDVNKVLYLAQADYFHKGNYGVSNITSFSERTELIEFLKLENTKKFKKLLLDLKEPPKKISWSYDGIYSFLRRKSSSPTNTGIEEYENDVLTLTVKEIISYFLFYIHDRFDPKHDQPGEIVFYPEHFKIKKFDGDINRITEGLALFELLSETLQDRGVDFKVVFLPDVSLSQSEKLNALRKSIQYQNLIKKNIIVADLIDFNLLPIIENFDGKHLTTYGNKRIAIKLYEEVVN